MKKKLTIYFVISLFIGTAIYIAQQYACSLPNWMQFYLNDFLVMPIILTPSLWILRWSRKDRNYTIPLWIIVYICGFYSIFFEYVLPQFHPRYTADSIDVILYFAGGFVFHYLQKNSHECREYP